VPLPERPPHLVLPHPHCSLRRLHARLSEGVCALAGAARAPFAGPAPHGGWKGQGLDFEGEVEGVRGGLASELD
jgi:hypothetical protein